MMTYIFFKAKIALYCILKLILLLVLLPIVLIRPRNLKNMILLSYLMGILSKIYNIKWTLRRFEIANMDSGAVLVCNHQTMLDALGVSAFYEHVKNATLICKKELLNMWPAGQILQMAGCTMIDRKDAKAAYEVFKDLALKIQSEKIKVIIFPEGTRHNEKGMLPFKNGAFKLAIDSQAPIVPVVFSPYYFMNREKHLFNSGRMVITCLDPIPTKGMTFDDIEILKEKTRNIMLKHYEGLCREVLSKLPAGYPLESSYLNM